MAAQAEFMESRFGPGLQVGTRRAVTMHAAVLTRAIVEIVVACQAVDRGMLRMVEVERQWLRSGQDRLSPATNPRRRGERGEQQ